MPGSSPEVELPEADPAPVSETDVKPAADSSSPDPKGEPSLIDRVTSALTRDKSETSPDSERDPVDPVAPKPDGEAKAVPDGELELGELTEQELKRYGPKTQRRMQALLRDRKQYEERATAAEAKATHFDQIADFATKHRLSNDDLSIVLEIGALLRNDPFRARERLTPIMAKLDDLTGTTLPPELQERVRLGYISEADARELATVRRREAHTRAQTEEQKQDAEAERQRHNTTAHVNAMSTVAREWEAARQDKDPDWSLKQNRIGELVKLQVYETGYPKSKDKVVEMLDGILKTVNAEYARFTPKPKEVRPATGTASSRATAEPKTALEAARLALSGSL